jgi:hypothetical protein
VKLPTPCVSHKGVYMVSATPIKVKRENKRKRLNEKN